MQLQILAKEAVGESTRTKIWADKVEAALGTCLIAECEPELTKFVQDILPREPFLGIRNLWECISDSIVYGPRCCARA